MIDRRDRALLLLGLASALRRAELAALTVADLGFVEEGVTLAVARSKTDQKAAGQVVGVVAPGTRPAPSRRCGHGWRLPASPVGAEGPRVRKRTVRNENTGGISAIST
jgi:hypothetical protein